MSSKRVTIAKKNNSSYYKKLQQIRTQWDIVDNNVDSPKSSGSVNQGVYKTFVI